MQQILVIHIPAFGVQLLQHHLPHMAVAGLPLKAVHGVFPAGTATAQASFRTARFPDEHGIVGNAFLNREIHRVVVAESSSTLVRGARIWERRKDKAGADSSTLPSSRTTAD